MNDTHNTVVSADPELEAVPEEVAFTIFGFHPHYYNATHVIRLERDQKLPPKLSWLQKGKKAKEGHLWDKDIPSSKCEKVSKLKYYEEKVGSTGSRTMIGCEPGGWAFEIRSPIEGPARDKMLVDLRRMAFMSGVTTTGFGESSHDGFAFPLEGFPGQFENIARFYPAVSTEPNAPMPLG
eukprot:SAG31_NODE_2771_length_5116_cov_3.598964_4_plen_180_part_00